MILSDDKVSAVLFNIFGGITRCDEVAKGLIEAFRSDRARRAVRGALDGTNDKEGRALLAEAEPRTSTRRRPCWAPPRRSWSWPADGDPGRRRRVCVSGITGREGTFHSLRNRDYGTQVVAGVTPGKGGQDVDGIPVFNTFHEAVSRGGRTRP